MPELVFDTQALGYLRLFEEMTGARVRDCVEVEGRVVLLVEPGEIRKAVGPRGQLVESLKQRWHREIQVAEYSNDPGQLARNLFYPFGVQRVEIVPKGEGQHATVTVAPAWKARAIGRAGRNLKVARAVLMRHTDIRSVSVA